MAASAHAGDSVAVIVVGSDADGIVELQESLEGQLTSLGVELVNPDTVAGVTGQREAEKAEDALAAAVRTSLADARKAYYEADISTVLAQLQIVERSLEQAPPLGDDERDYHLLRAATHLDAGDQRSANYHIEKALTFDYAIRPDPELYRPAVGELLDQVRERKGRAVLRLGVKAEGAQMWIDGRKVTGKGTPVLPGVVHEVRVEATGYAPRTKNVELAPGQEQAIDFRLPYYVEAQLDHDVRALVDGDRDAPSKLAGLFEADQTEVLVLAVEGGGAAVLRTPETVVDTKPTVDLAWAGSAARDALAKRGHFSGVHVVKRGWRFHAGVGGSVITDRQELTDGAGGAGAARQALGFGPRVSVEVLTASDVLPWTPIRSKKPLTIFVRSSAQWRSTSLGTSLGTARTFDFFAGTGVDFPMFNGHGALEVAFGAAYRSTVHEAVAEAVNLYSWTRFGFNAGLGVFVLPVQSVRVGLDVELMSLANIGSDPVFVSAIANPVGGSVGFLVHWRLGESWELRPEVRYGIHVFQFDLAPNDQLRFRTDAAWGGSVAIHRWF